MVVSRMGCLFLRCDVGDQNLDFASWIFSNLTLNVQFLLKFVSGPDPTVPMVRWFAPEINIQPGITSRCAITREPDYFDPRNTGSHRSLLNSQAKPELYLPRSYGDPKDDHSFFCHWLMQAFALRLQRWHFRASLVVGQPISLSTDVRRSGKHQF